MLCKHGITKKGILKIYKLHKCIKNVIKKNHSIFGGKKREKTTESKRYDCGRIRLSTLCLYMYVLGKLSHEKRTLQLLCNVALC